MRSAAHLYSFPVPLGRRGTAAAAVIGIHALLVVALLGAVAHRTITTPDERVPIAKFLPPPQPAPPVRRAPSFDPPVPGVVTPQPYDIPLLQPTRPTEVAGPAIPTGDVGRAVETPPPVPATGPRILASSEPSYPPSERRLGHEGSVQLRVRVDALGRPEAVEVARSSGYPRLDAAALDAVRSWRFVPAQAEGRAIAAWVTFTVTFRLTDR